MAVSRSWYLLAYDIRDPKRLQKVHYYLRKRALAAQLSVFFLHTSEDGLVTVLDGVASRIDPRQDDVRAYPIQHPGDIWLGGRAAVGGGLLKTGGGRSRTAVADTVAAPSGVRGLFKRLWGPRRER